jgi:hypothetical protein
LAFLPAAAAGPASVVLRFGGMATADEDGQKHTNMYVHGNERGVCRGAQCHGSSTGQATHMIVVCTAVGVQPAVDDLPVGLVEFPESVKPDILATGCTGRPRAPQRSGLA